MGNVFGGIMDILLMPFKLIGGLFQGIMGMFGGGSGRGMFGGLLMGLGGLFGMSGGESGGGLGQSLTSMFSSPSSDTRVRAPAAAEQTVNWTGHRSLRKPFSGSAAPRTEKTASLRVAGNTPGYDPLKARAEHGATDIEAFDPQLQAPLARVMDRLRAKGWNPRVASGVRTHEEQQQKKDEGVSATSGGYHPMGLAADIVNGKQEGRKGSGWEGEFSDKEHPFWKDLQAAAEAEGLTSGAIWTKKEHGIEQDVAHVYLKKGAAPATMLAHNHKGHGHGHGPGAPT